MSLESSRNFAGVEIRHSERAACLGLTPLLVAFYLYMANSIWNLIVGKVGGFSAVPGPEKVILAFSGLSLLLTLLITLFALVYLPATLSISRNGTVTRKILGIPLTTRVDAPYHLYIRAYARQTALKKIHYFDLHLRGPAGSHLVTMRGDPENFRALSESARIPILTDMNDRTRQAGAGNLDNRGR